jgi:Uma2 family endonuclease
MTPEEFDAVTEYDELYRYELIEGVLVVSPSPDRAERDPNEELGFLLRYYMYHHPQGGTLDLTLSEETVKPGRNRRRADRAIWAGLGRPPGRDETPTILVEFVSEGRSNRTRDYEAKQAEYLRLGVREYWVFDRFERSMTVWRRGPRSARATCTVLREADTYRTPLLPGFELPLSRLLAAADRSTLPPAPPRRGRRRTG